MRATPDRRLLVAWRQPDRLTVPIGILSRSTTDGTTEYAFSYIKRAESVEGFEPLPGLRDLYTQHRSRVLFPLIANRLMSSDRPDYEEWLAQLGLEPAADIFDVLERSGGKRVTDNVEVFPFPHIDDGALTTRFFVRGIRHVDGGIEAARQLEAGSALAWRREPTNQVNPAALLLDRVSGRSVGYAPDYLIQTILDLQSFNGRFPETTVERVNPAAAPSNMVLATLTASCPPDYRPFDDADYQPITG